tara:strand:- start:2338 stop:2628 length:291 start_codon:yes stop_codon:yes gene_type:complete
MYLEANMYYNTNKERGSELRSSRAKVNKQENVILNVFNNNVKLSPEEVLRFSGLNAPLTSIRRAITNLTDKGLLKKTGTMKKGSYGKMVHTWQKIR